ncbi:peptidase [Roseicyclus sp. F158]|uniref:Peptidase n=1 Tax=Tropicimonas omnivorans TaxID=3075590 RepID=A0ABU3DJ64_9RHOB|nr:peptidase [Roseicyclus sp. F158]MDT0683623.1 peptidase [Roseicyclus sp. F158]
MRPEAVAIARCWIGTPYRHAASVQGHGTDCLGLVRGIWRTLYGDEPGGVPPYTLDWGEPQGDERMWAAARRLMPERPRGEATEAGDILLFRMRQGGIAKHLGVAAETGARPSFIHAFQGHAVVESPLTRPWARRIVARFILP